MVKMPRKPPNWDDDFRDIESPATELFGPSSGNAPPLPKPEERDAQEDGALGAGSNTISPSHAGAVEAPDPVGNLLGGISTAEGTDDAAVARSNGKFGSGYDVTYMNNRYGIPSRPISQMTLDELHQYQRQMLNNPDNRARSSAVGKYQIVGTTMRNLERQMGLNGSEVFSPDLQDRMARRLIQDNGLSAYQAGKITPQQFQDFLATQWDSVPASATGKTMHGGRLGMTPERVQDYISHLPRR